MNVGELIKNRREELGMTQDELARLIGYKGRAAVSKIETDGRGIKQDKIMKLANALHVSPGYIMGWEDIDGNPIDDTPTNLYPVKRKTFKVLGEIACGQPIYAEEEHSTYINASSDIDADFCLVAKGDSMIDARIHDGDVVFIKSTPMVENGDIAAVIIDDEATLKRWYFYPQEKKLVLSPANPKYAPLVYVGKELTYIRCIGKAVCFMSNL